MMCLMCAWSVFVFYDLFIIPTVWSLFKTRIKIVMSSFRKADDAFNFRPLSIDDQKMKNSSWLYSPFLAPENHHLKKEIYILFSTSQKTDHVSHQTHQKMEIYIIFVERKSYPNTWQWDRWLTRPELSELLCCLCPLMIFLTLFHVSESSACWCQVQTTFYVTHITQGSWNSFTDEKGRDNTDILLSSRSWLQYSQKAIRLV